MSGYLSINKWPLRYQNARLKVRGNFFYTDSNSFSGVSCLDLSHHDANGNYCYIADSFIDIAVEVDNWTGSPQTGWQTITLVTAPWPAPRADARGHGWTSGWLARSGWLEHRASAGGQAGGELGVDLPCRLLEPGQELLLQRPHRDAGRVRTGVDGRHDLA